MPGKIMENRGNREIILPQSTKTAPFPQHVIVLDAGSGAWHKKGDIAGAVASITEVRTGRNRVKKLPCPSRVNRDSATRRARRLGVQSDVSELAFLFAMKAFVTEKLCQR